MQAVNAFLTVVDQRQPIHSSALARQMHYHPMHFHEVPILMSFCDCTRTPVPWSSRSVELASVLLTHDHAHQMSAWLSARVVSSCSNSALRRLTNSRLHMQGHSAVCQCPCASWTRGLQKGRFGKSCLHAHLPARRPTAMARISGNCVLPRWACCSRSSPSPVPPSPSSPQLFAFCPERPSVQVRYYNQSHAYISSREATH